MKVMALHTWFRASTLRDIKLSGILVLLYMSKSMCFGLTAFVVLLLLSFCLDLFYFCFDREDINQQMDMDVCMVISDHSKVNKV